METTATRWWRGVHEYCNFFCSAASIHSLIHFGSTLNTNKLPLLYVIQHVMHNYVLCVHFMYVCKTTCTCTQYDGKIRKYAYTTFIHMHIDRDPQTQKKCKLNYYFLHHTSHNACNPTSITPKRCGDGGKQCCRCLSDTTAATTNPQCCSTLLP